MRMKGTKSGCIILLVLCQLQLQAQNYQHKHFGLDEGFPEKQAREVVQDSLGFLWIGTANGFVRFNGIDFVPYRAVHKPQDSLNSLPKNVLGLDADGSLWLGNINANVLYRYDCRTDRFINYKLDLGDAVIRSFARGKGDSLIWLGSRGHGLYSYNLLTRKLNRYANEPADSAIAPNPKGFKRLTNFIYDLVDEGDHLLLATGRGLWSFSKENKTFKHIFISGYNITYLDNPLLIKYPSIVKVPVHEDGYWFQVNENLHVILVKTDKNFNLLQQYALPEEFYTGNNFMPLTVDRTGSFWIESKKGLISYNPADNKIVVHDTVSYLNDIFVDRNNNIWVTQNNGLHRFTKRSINFNNHFFNDPMRDGHTPELTGLEFLTINRKNYLVSVSKVRFCYSLLWGR